MKKPVILLAEADVNLRKRLQGLLLNQKFAVIEAGDQTGILRTLRRKQNIDLLIVNASLSSSCDGLEAAQLVRRWNPRLPVIILATHSSEELAITALRAGVKDYFKQPFACEEVLAAVRRCLADCLPQKSAPPDAATVSPAPLVSDAGSRDGPQMLGESQPMQEIKAYTARVAPSDSNVLITGETGTGKELVAEFIHRNSRRQQKPFVDINCAAIPDSLLESELFGYEKGAFTGASSAYEGKLKLANGGTVFFDEIGDMSSYAQAKILRAIESREVQRLGAKKGVPVDVRVVAATNQDLERLMSEDKFRKDLYFRLNVARVHLPPLRDRKEDIPALFDHYLDQFNHRFGREVEGFTDEALESLLRYDWPGNVRELKNLLEAIFVDLPARRISFVDLPAPFHRRLKETAGLPQDERDRLLSALFSTHWNMTKAAQKLHWSRMTLYRKMAKYHIEKGER